MATVRNPIYDTGTHLYFCRLGQGLKVFDKSSNSIQSVGGIGTLEVEDLKAKQGVNQIFLVSYDLGIFVGDFPTPNTGNFSPIALRRSGYSPTNTITCLQLGNGTYWIGFGDGIGKYHENSQSTSVWDEVSFYPLSGSPVSNIIQGKVNGTGAPIEYVFFTSGNSVYRSLLNGNNPTKIIEFSSSHVPPPTSGGYGSSNPIKDMIYDDGTKKIFACSEDKIFEFSTNPHAWNDYNVIGDSNAPNDSDLYALLLVGNSLWEGGEKLTERRNTVWQNPISGAVPPGDEILAMTYDSTNSKIWYLLEDAIPEIDSHTI